MAKRIAWHRYISSQKQYAEKGSVIDEILYRNRVSLLDPERLGSAGPKSFVRTDVDDIFIKGLREASPDMAMAAFFEMDQIEYLVTHARLTHDNGNDVLQDYDIIRLMFVVFWISGKSDMLQSEQQVPDYIEFAFENQGAEFVFQYIAEYMPQKQDNEKLVELAADAVVRFCIYMDAAAWFRINYAIYSEQFRQLAESYAMYCRPSDEAKKQKPEHLIKLAKKRREAKIRERKEMFSPQQRKQIEAIFSETAEFKYGIHHEGIRDPKKIRQHVRKILTGEGTSAEEYRRRVSSYNRESFDITLQFIHSASRQITFEMLSGHVKANAPVPETGIAGSMLGSEASAQVEDAGTARPGDAREEIADLIRRLTSAEIWAMSGFSYHLARFRNALCRDSSDKAIWYIAFPGGKELLPTALSAANPDNGGKTIFRGIDNDLQRYLRFLLEREGMPVELKELKEYEAIAYMTIDSPEKRSNLIPWKGSLSECLTGSRGEVSLYLFSPARYLKARMMIISYYSGFFHEMDMHAKYEEVPVIFGDGSRNAKYHRYFLCEGTDSVIEDTEKSMKGDRTIRNLQDIIRTLPVPVNLIGLHRNCRFIAYDLATPVVSDPKEYSTYTLDCIQNMFMQELYDKRPDSKLTMRDIVNQHAFVCQINISYDVLEQLEQLAGWTISH